MGGTKKIYLRHVKKIPNEIKILEKFNIFISFKTENALILH